jgi:sterol-4alpha-carboxylate 3-dehydrogenase (decarboxylating)
MAPTKRMDTNQQSALGSVLVIGGCGFLGHHVVNMILRDWVTSHIAVVDLTTTRNRRPESDGVEYIDADITDADNLLKIFGRIQPDVVIHTASPAPHATAVNANSLKALFRKVNVEGTRAVVAAAQQAGVSALVYTSSASIISDNKSDLINASELFPVIRGKAQPEYYSETKVTYATRPCTIPYVLC